MEWGEGRERRGNGERKEREVNVGYENQKLVILVNYYQE